MDGSLLDMGAGAGRDALYYQERFETVAIEVSERLVEVMRDRGVNDARLADMFALRDHFDRDRFRSAHAIGTQVGLAGSMAGVRQFLDDLAFVTTPDATAVLDNYAPEKESTKARSASATIPRPDSRTGSTTRSTRGKSGEPCCSASSASTGFERRRSGRRGKLPSASTATFNGGRYWKSRSVSLHQAGEFFGDSVRDKVLGLEDGFSTPYSRLNSKPPTSQVNINPKIIGIE